LRTGIALAIAIVAFALPSAGSAAPPTNDAFASATQLASLPFSASVDVSEATLEGGEPAGACWPLAGSAWYEIQPSEDMVIRIGTTAIFDRTFNVYRQSGVGFGGLAFVACGYSWSQTTAKLTGGETYFVQAGRTPWTSGGLLGLDIAIVPPPPNDDFADSRAVGTLPYVDSVEMSAATVEPGEPTTPPGLSGPFVGTAWYAFVAPESGSMLVSELGCCASMGIGVYTGGSVESLVAVPLTRAFGRHIFTAAAGETYMIQLGHRGLSSSGSLGIRVEKTPLPSATLFWNPFDPSSFDTVGFFGSAFDPAAIGISSWEWDFGDGTNSSGQSTSHRYSVDGDYEVILTVATPDGRSASSTRTVSVRTHDVGIVKLQVPQAAAVGQTRSISVSVVSDRYGEMVTVQLYRSVPGGFAPVGSLTQSIQLRKRATPFAFSYTFTADDAALGKVTFKAVATIVGVRDALPADNEVVSLPTKVG